MHTQDMLSELFHNVMQLGIAITIILLQRWLLELSTFEKDVAWLKRQEIYWLWRNAKWYRGMELVHQFRARRLLKDL